MYTHTYIYVLHGGGAREHRGEGSVGQGGRDGVDAHGGGQLRGEGAGQALDAA